MLECYSRQCANVNTFALHAADAYDVADAVFQQTRRVICRPSNEYSIRAGYQSCSPLKGYLISHRIEKVPASA